MPKKIVGKKVASKSASKSAIKKVKKAPAKKAVKKVAKKAPAKKVVAKKAPAKKAAPAKRSPNIVKPSLAKSAKKVVGKPFPAKLQSTTKGDSTTITVTPNEVAVTEVLVEERRLTMLPPPRPSKTIKKGTGLKPIKGAPAPLIISDGIENWTATELKAMRSELSKDLIRLREELAEVESGMEDLINAEGMGAGDDQADAGTKTFEREHEMSLVYNARDMVVQTERALERIDNKTYGRCEECENSIGKARLQVFPRATLCMSCKQKEERR
ncbi:MAG: molecular chaperone DnaK [Actinobacteria bacterium]|nr:molecular chaperone DnaK [Actinomycetota bacterium]